MSKVLSLSMMAVALVGGVASTNAHPKPQHHHHHHRNSVMCKRYQHIVTRASKKGPEYIVRNDNYGHLKECIANHAGRPNFRVVRQEENVGHAEPVSFPNIFFGCSWGICTKHSGLPKKITKVKHLVTSWSVREKAKGTWGAGYDIWFDRTKRISGQSRGAELMIWLNSRGFPANHWPLVKVGKTWYHLAHWTARSGSKHWQYIQFRRLHSSSRIKNLSVMPFIKVAERYGFISKHWWLISVEAGFEIWKGGIGLGTKNFEVHMR